MHNSSEFFETMHPVVKEFLSSKRLSKRYKMKTFECFKLLSVKKRSGMIIIQIQTDQPHTIYVKDKLWGLVHEDAVIIRFDN